MISSVFLDAGPLSLLTQRRGKSGEADACKRWLASLSLQGIHVYVPEIADYEVRRELVRAKKTAGVVRLDTLKTRAHYLPISTDAMLLAAQLWAQVRNQGLPTADPHALDADVILAAQALTSGRPPSDIVIATTNVGHLARFVAADLWQNITP
jgi:predicted nucleic acid-binding protein